MISLKKCVNSRSGALLGLFVAFGCSKGAPTPAPKAPEPTPAADEDDPRYQSLPTPTAAKDWAPPSATQTKLANGLTLWHMNHGGAPLVSIHLMLPTGSSTDPKGKSGLTLLTADLLDEGAGKLSALEISDALGELATDYSSSAGVDYVLLSMNALSENLDASLAILADLVQRPTLHKDEFERRKQHHLATALSSRDEQDNARNKAIGTVLFGSGYAGLPPTGIESSLRTLTHADVKAHAKKMNVPDGAHLTIAGVSDQAAALASVTKHFGKWSGKLSLHTPEILTPTLKNAAFVVDFPGAAQSSMAIVTRAGSDEEPNYFPEEVMNQKIGQSFTSRINMNLREDKGYTYGAFSVFRRYQKAGYFAVMSNVRSDATSQSVQEVYSELAALCKERPLTSDERNESVEGLLLGYPIQFDEVSSVGMRLVALPIHRRPVDFWKTWPDNVRDVTTAQANAAAAPYCTRDRYTVVVSGDQASVTPALEKLGFQVTLLDRDGARLPTDSQEKPSTQTK